MIFLHLKHLKTEIFWILKNMYLTFLPEMYYCISVLSEILKEEVTKIGWQ